jgi:mono/diheme cytochrome c family protein
MLVCAMTAACGGGQGSRSATAAHSTSATAARSTSATAARSTSASAPPSTPAGAAAASGRVAFGAHCSVCHSLTGKDNPRLQGGDLLGFHASRSQVVQFVREMPVIHRPLTAAELQAVVDYVMAAERAAQRR